MIFITVAAGLAPAAACNKNEVPVPDTYTLQVPAHFPAPPAFDDNPLSEVGVELGRLLFYDKRLSGNNKISCGTCHRQDLAFSDALALANTGISGQTLHRTAPALINLAWANNGLFWDGGSTNLESQAFGPLTSPDEMGQNLAELVAELNAVSDYVSRFRQVFKDEIKSAYIVRALAQFQRTFISGSARYDKYVNKVPGVQLSPTELQGLSLIQQKCQGCHAGALFTDDDYHNNGLDADFSDDSHEGIYQGRSRITYNPTDLGKFKTPTLRNVMLTAPYMHDGRFATIEAVLDHYSNGVQVSPTTDPLVMQNGGTAGIPLTITEKLAIIAFLHALTDTEFTANKKLSNPHP